MSLTLSAVVLAPGLLLIEDQPVIASFWLLAGSFALMAWTYRRPWRLMWLTILMPPVAAGGAYAVQLAFLPGAPDAEWVVVALLVGMVAGIFRGRAHRVFARDNAIFAQRTVAYLGLWLVCYVVSQVFSFANMKGMVSVGRVGGAFSTSMLVVVCAVLLIRFWRERRALGGHGLNTRAALGVLLAAVLIVPLAWVAEPAHARLVANECKVTAYPDSSSPDSPAVFIQQTHFNRPRTGDLLYSVYVIQNPDSGQGRAIVARFWPQEVPPISARDSYQALLAKAKTFCRENSVSSSVEIVGAPQPPPPVTQTPPTTAPGGGTAQPSPGTWEPYVSLTSGVSAEDVAGATALVSVILIIAGIGANVASGVATAAAGAAQAVAEAAAQEAGESSAEATTGRRPRSATPRVPEAAGSGSESDGAPAATPRAGGGTGPALRPGIAGVMGESASNPDADLGAEAGKEAGSTYDTLTDPNNWWPFGRGMAATQKAADDLSAMVGEAGWDNTGLGWGINLVTGTLGRAAGEIADLPRQAAAAAGWIHDEVSDGENWTVVYETGRDSIRDLGGFIAGHRGTQDKVMGDMKKGVETAGSIAGTLSVDVEQDPAGAAVAVTMVVLGADNWSKVIDGDVPLLERWGRALWGGVDTGGTIWGIGTTAAGAAGRVSTFVRGADLTGDLATGARVANQAGDAAAAGRGVSAAEGLSDGARIGETADALGDAGAAGRAGNLERTIDGGAGRRQWKDPDAVPHRPEAGDAPHVGSSAAAESAPARAGGTGTVDDGHRGVRAADRRADASHGDDAGVLAKDGDEADDLPGLPRRREAADPDLVSQREQKVRDVLEEQGVREDLRGRMGYEHDAPEGQWGSTRGGRHDEAGGALHRDAFERPAAQGGGARSDTSVRSTAQHELDHVQQHDQLRTQAAPGGPKEGYYDPQTGRLTAEGNLEMEIEVRMRELDRNLAIREDAIKRAGANPADPSTWPQEALDADEEVAMARSYLDRNLPPQAPPAPDTAAAPHWDPNAPTDPNIDLADLQRPGGGRGDAPDPGRQDLDPVGDDEADEILREFGMDKESRK